MGRRECGAPRSPVAGQEVRRPGTSRRDARAHHRAELEAKITQADIYGGSTNRFMWLLAASRGTSPRGGNVPASVISAAASALAPTIFDARRGGVRSRTPAAARLWNRIYREMSTDRPQGVLAEIITRDQATTLRLSLAYSLADGSPVIDTVHVLAAEGLWRYCRDCAERIFGDLQGDPDLDRLLAAIAPRDREASPSRSSPRPSAGTLPRTGSQPFDASSNSDD